MIFGNKEKSVNLKAQDLQESTQLTRQPNSNEKNRCRAYSTTNRGIFVAIILRKNMESNKSILMLLFLWLICTSNSASWQGTGNFTKSNLTVISNYIEANFSKSWNNAALTEADNTLAYNFARSMSDHLNSLWDRAWNVFVVYQYTFTNVDSVLYGYGFRDHWMWYNGIRMVDYHYSTIIIWKDYNCDTWHGFNQAESERTSNTFQSLSPFNSVISTYYGSVDLQDIWTVAQNYAEALQKRPEFPDSAFTVIASSTSYIYYFGRFCAKNFLKSVSELNEIGGTAFFMQMR